jgi:uncharacterized protein
VERPLPQPTAVTSPFWEAARGHKLVHPWCARCQQAFFPPHLLCPHCRSAGWSWSQSQGRGVVYSFSVVHRAPLPGFEPPYVLAVVDLHEGFELMTNVVGVRPDRVHIGMRVEVTWLEAGDQALPVFRPVDEIGETL